MKSTLLIGATGQLGSDLIQVLRKRGHTILAPSLKELDITEHGAVEAYVNSHRPTVVINTAAFLRVDDCEDEYETAWRVNAYAARNLAMVCQGIGATLVHVSTDYVFGGHPGQENAWSESDVPSPLNVYGMTKLEGEYAVQAYCERHLVVRSAGLYGLAGSRLKGGNFVETMLRLGSERDTLRVVNDQFLTPTFTADLADSMVDAVEKDARGLLHITNAGRCSWHEFAAAIFEFAGIDVALEAIPSSEYPTKATRPSFSVLSNERLKGLGVSEPRHWRDALAAFLLERNR